MSIDFIVKNWYLFAALVFIVAMILLEPMRRRASGVREVAAFDVPQLLNHDHAVVVDVSSPQEFREGHIPSAIGIPLPDLDKSLKKIQKYKDKPVVLVCRSGNRAHKAASVLRKNEFSNLYVLTGGLGAWQKENFPLET